MVKSEDLKRLAFVRNYSGFCFSKGCNLASSVYSTGLAYAPAPFNSSVRAMEQAVCNYSFPIVTAVQDQSVRALYQLDHQVWYFIVSYSSRPCPHAHAKILVG